jgi:hypothetical protein
MTHLLEPGKDQNEDACSNSEESAQKNRKIISFAHAAVVQIHRGETAKNSRNDGKHGRNHGNRHKRQAGRHPAISVRRLLRSVHRAR